MPIIQHQLAFARPLAARVRGIRRPFRPSPASGPYRLPHDVRDRLSASLAPFRNRDAAFALATFVARFWSVPGRVAGSFPIDRRALANRGGLDLTEARVRGAIRTLEAVGFLERALPPSGSRYKATAGGLHRKPILFGFGVDYASAFLTANKRATAARGGRPGDRRPITPSTGPSPSIAPLIVPPVKSPKSTSEAEPSVIMGEIRSCIPPLASELNPNLEAALDRLLKGIRLSRSG